MTERQVLQPSAAHPITIRPTGRRVTVTVGGVIVAQTDDALTLQESTYPAVQYIPRSDVVFETLSRSATTTYCPYKGEANYYDVGGVADAVWTYEQPYPAVAEIAGHLAFYPDKADIALA
ncbi:hypothetical protein ACT17_27485 [Mycolicibacterium conceptionense]|jgi:uncharacterized protein (DUF427 family)|uniref:DUF427 domain-containing protein n=3 Tax=Mycolicibacterium TaxID=1866885 RepID=A0ABR5FYY4_9MYCO|nr:MULTISPECIES: DUF427 domain-containing protein [Mycolicibacterium]KLI08942.1 hypothetical protein AA982_05510 [Mycolicibacterium senegalense]KLO52983.1 hypothetical protein ABW05_17245 [Mycolicibacterium senegalense]KMV14969.1 hypothetical protein ACT17_27485 [Mycolicibacterium conceptionense]OBJ95880.1 hypothetical protein A5639_03430 [Mycolicibacterium conceptionense]OMB71773.1 hypothetical protein A5741_06810 [Mycolicibacterium conceptionense]